MGLGSGAEIFAIEALACAFIVTHCGNEEMVVCFRLKIQLILQNDFHRTLIYGSTPSGGRIVGTYKPLQQTFVIVNHRQNVVFVITVRYYQDAILIYVLIRSNVDRSTYCTNVYFNVKIGLKNFWSFRSEVFAGEVACPELILIFEFLVNFDRPWHEAATSIQGLIVGIKVKGRNVPSVNTPSLCVFGVI